jgi:membrane carboxypeptidase/penicillin-binding protein
VRSAFSLLELTSAYGAFANQGVLVDPHLVDEVRDRDGVLVSRRPPPCATRFGRRSPT